MRSFFKQNEKPKEKYSIENFRYLVGQLKENPQVTPENQALIVECLRTMSELIIWGDQNSQAVLDACLCVALLLLLQLLLLSRLHPAAPALLLS